MLGSDVFPYILGYDPETTVEVDVELNWSVYNTISVDQEIRWQTGEPVPYWYRVEGCCQHANASGSGLDDGVPGGCDVIPFQSPNQNCTGAGNKVKYIQNILATSMTDLCQQLRDSKWTWQICSVQRFSRPAINSVVEDDDACNVLVDVPFNTLVDCMEFALAADGIAEIAISTFSYDTFYDYVVDGGLELTGDTIIQIEVDEVDYIGSGGLELSSSSEVESDVYEVNYVGDGGLEMTGDSEITSTWQGLYLADIGFAAELELMEATLGGSDVDDLPLPTETINSSCASCNTLPLTLELSHNLQNVSVYKEFLKRNGLLFDRKVRLHYNRTNQIWQSNTHYTGLGTNGEETWRTLMEWGCTDQIVFERKMFKFGLYFSRKNNVTGSTMDTRLLLTFPPEDICNLTEFSFAFDMDLVNRFVNNSLDIETETNLLYDHIGLFKSAYWLDNNLSINLSVLDLTQETEKKSLQFIL